MDDDDLNGKKKRITTKKPLDSLAAFLLNDAF